MVVAVEEQSALLRVAMLVARGMRLEELFAHVCEESARLLGIDATGVLRYIGGERAVVVGVWRTGGARGLPVNAELDFHHSDSAIGRALATKAPARVSNYDHARGELPAVMRSMGMSASVATPVLVDGEPWGAIVATAVDEAAAEARPRVNPIAIVALVLACVGGIPAIAFGHIALGQIRQTGERGRTMAIVATALGYLWLAVGVVLLLRFANGL